MRKLVLVLWYVIAVVVFCKTAEAQQQITQYLPHFVAGSLSASDWESEIFLANLSDKPNTVTVDFFDNFGNPLVVTTNKGTNNSFVVILPKPAPDSVSSDTLEILRSSASFLTGWAKVYSVEPFAVDLEFRQFVFGETKPVGKADVAPSPIENVLTYPLAPKNGIALVNPGSQDANVNFKAFDRVGNKIREGNFGLKRGGHAAMFFSQEPFVLDATGIIVIASNIPLSSIALNFDGLVFKTIPRISTPRRLDSQPRAAKIGFVYIHSDDRQSQPGVLERFTEYVKFQQTLLDKELLLNGFNRVQLPYDLDENGLPKITVINGGNREQYFDHQKTGLARIHWDLFFEKVKKNTPSDWKKRVVFVDMWLDEEINGQRNDILSSSWGDYSMLSARYIPFFKKAYFGDKRPYRGVPIPEFGGKPMPNGGDYGQTFEDLADAAISLLNHENGHTFWSLDHSDIGTNSSFQSMVGKNSQNGCMNPSRSIECILLPIEANGVVIGKLSRPNDFNWILEDFSFPFVEVLSHEIVGSKLRVTFRTEDLESGINSFLIHTLFESPYAHSWRTVGHLDNLESITIEADITGVSSDIYLEVLNNQGHKSSIKLF